MYQIKGGLFFIIPQRLLEKLKATGTPLGEYVDGKIYRGVLTGLNKAFVIDEETKELLIEEDASSAEIIKPFLAGRDIKRYQVPEPENYLIFTRRGIEIDKYPAVKKYLEGFKKELKPRPKDVPNSKWSGRKPGNYAWYEIQDAIDYYEEFEKPKVILPDISLRGNFTYDDSSKNYLVNTAYIIPDAPRFLLGILASESIDFFYRNISSSYRGGYLRFIFQYLEQIPIPETNKKQEQFLSEKVNQILTAKKENPEADTTNLEAEIDRLVYELYGLSEEEIGIVEGSLE